MAQLALPPKAFLSAVVHFAGIRLFEWSLVFRSCLY